MSDELRGTCDACGKVYRVPSAERTYPCKACGGTVRANVGATTTGAAASPAEPRVGSRARVAGPAAGERPVRASARPSVRAGVGTPDAVAAGAGGRRPYSPRKRSLWTPVLGVVVVLVVAAAIVKVYMAARFPKRGQDFDTISADFVQAWSSSDLDEIAAFHPTQGRTGLRERLDAILESRSWSRLPEPTAWGTAERDARASIVVLQLGDAGEVSTTWQHDPIGQRWWLLDLELPMLPLGDAPERFRAAWSRSDPGALQPFFRDDTAEKMAALVVRETTKRGWERWPALGAPSLALSANRPGALDASHAVGDDELLRVRWAFHERSDRWVVTGFDFP